MNLMKIEQGNGRKEGRKEEEDLWKDGWIGC
jgi:hypothetical protein